ncbi:hypothetical protein KSP40_PGU004431 [Platanthera guangdongensis]|uniref:Uncharacterized protein n=1 Tax=Platanthera guangdongensis TaxID=2320717 RepID=A0ABR2MR13_9ASPA
MGRSSFRSIREKDEVNSLYEKVTEEERTTEYKEACFVKVMGEDGHGRVRTWGSGISKPQSSEDASKSIRSQIREEVQSQFDSQIAKMKAQMDETTGVQQNMQVLLERADIH